MIVLRRQRAPPNRPVRSGLRFVRSKTCEIDSRVATPTRRVRIFLGSLDDGYTVRDRVVCASNMSC